VYAPNLRFFSALTTHDPSTPLAKGTSTEYERALLPEIPQWFVFSNFARYRRKIMALHANEKIGRDDPCPCGSGKKYKRCSLERRNASYGIWVRQRDASDQLTREMMRFAARTFGDQRPPRLTNTDGDPLVFHTLQFRMNRQKRRLKLWRLLPWADRRRTSRPKRNSMAPKDSAS
jgi:SEC-C motif